MAARTPRSASLDEKPMSWQFQRTCQCAKCPWRKNSNPREIPNGYSEEKHRALAGSIPKSDPSPLQIIEALEKRELHVMSCHDEHEAMCVGWLRHQAGAGNNIALRLHLAQCDNISQIRLHGEQHETFEATLPAPVSV